MATKAKKPAPAPAKSAKKSSGKATPKANPQAKPKSSQKTAKSLAKRLVGAVQKTVSAKARPKTKPAKKPASTRAGRTVKKAGRTVKKATRSVKKATRDVKKAIRRVKKATPAAKLFTRMGLTPLARERGVNVDDYASGLAGWQREVVQKIRSIVREVAPNATESIKWGQPVFELNGPFAWMKAFTKHIGYGFWRGTELPDPARVLEGDGERMRHVKVHAPESIPFEALRQLIKAAVAANLAKGDPTKRG